jgi:hypothetical protein
MPSLRAFATGAAGVLKINRKGCLQYGPGPIGGSGRNRTTDTRIFNPLLYRLSYRAKGAIIAARPSLRQIREPTAKQSDFVWSLYFVGARVTIPAHP